MVSKEQHLELYQKVCSTLADKWLWSCRGKRLNVQHIKKLCDEDSWKN